MDLRDEVCSLPWAEQLRDMGVVQESHLMWCMTEDEHHAVYYETPYSIGRRRVASAFTIGELLSLLGPHFGVLERFKDGDWGAYIPNDIGCSAIDARAPDVLAQLLCKVLMLDVMPEAFVQEEE